MKTYRRKALEVTAFKWDGKPNEHVDLLGTVRGGDPPPCSCCGSDWFAHGRLLAPEDSVHSIVCPGYWIVVHGGAGLTECMSEERFHYEYEEA